MFKQPNNEQQNSEPKISRLRRMYLWGTSKHRGTRLAIQLIVSSLQTVAIFVTQGLFYSTLLNMFMPRTMFWLMDKYRRYILRNIKPQYRECFPTMVYLEEKTRAFLKKARTWI